MLSEESRMPNCIFCGIAGKAQHAQMTVALAWAEHEDKIRRGPLPSFSIWY
jgi:hypothetical protein